MEGIVLQAELLRPVQKGQFLDFIAVAGPQINRRALGSIPVQRQLAAFQSGRVIPYKHRNLDSGLPAQGIPLQGSGDGDRSGSISRGDNAMRVYGGDFLFPGWDGKDHIFRRNRRLPRKGHLRPLPRQKTSGRGIADGGQLLRRVGIDDPQRQLGPDLGAVQRRGSHQSGARLL